MTKRHGVRMMAAAAILATLAATAAMALPAFPGAEGFGADTPGGRGGRIIEVTTLDRDGPGSFAEAVKAEGPRIVVFRVAGAIDLRGNLSISQPFITIAGQTAPGDGICLVNGSLRVGTHDVVIRHLRVRVGDHPTGGWPGNRDGIGIESAPEQPHNIVIDHCSLSWAIDETLCTWYPCHDITVQWCIISEALDDSIHPKGPHSKGILTGPDTRRLSVHHNLLAHNARRNPLVSKDNEIEIVNNLVYDWDSVGTHIGNYEGDFAANIVSNYYLQGPDSNDSAVWIADHLPPGSVYLQGNVGVRWPDGGELPVPGEKDRTRGAALSQTPAFEPSDLRVHAASEIRDLVPAYAGATRPVRDVVDDRVVREVLSGTGHIIDSQRQVGGWPDYRSEEPPADSDHDAMPDAWETDHDLAPDDPSDGPADLDGDGYTNVEEYLNGTDPAVADTGEPPEQTDPQVQAGNDDLRFGSARRDPEPPEYRPEDRQAFARTVAASGQDVAAYVGLQMIEIPPGEFTRDGIVARITKPYAISATEVTRGQWESVMGTRPWEGEVWAGEAEGAPATYVSWHDAVEFCARLSAAGDAEYRLPTEAQWELACRAGGDSETGLWFEQEQASDLAWLHGSTVEAGEPWPHPVGTKPANDLGLFDMAGNVLEWCRDTYEYWYWRPQRSEPVKIDPEGYQNETGYRVLRGGSFYHSARDLFAYPASHHHPTYRNFDTGFRVARVQP